MTIYDKIIDEKIQYDINSGVAKLNEPANCDTKLNFCMNTA